MSTKRRFFVPEVIQTSNLDCGPAALKCLLEGFGRHVSYGRLREACQTGIDGTSVDAIESVANRLGLIAEQVMLPVDDLFMPEARSLPALIVVTLPIGLTHFVVVWRRHGKFLQVMDPASGRRWVSITEFRREIYRHTMAINAADWREFAASSYFQAILRARLRSTGLSDKDVGRLIGKTLEDPGWRGIAALDAAARFAEARGTADFCHPEATPAEYWQTTEGDRVSHLLLRGAVLLRVSGVSAQVDIDSLPPELVVAVTERPASAGRELLAAAGSKAAIPLVLISAGAAAAGMIAVEALLLRSLWGSASSYTLAAISGVLLFVLLIELPAVAGALRLGTQVEMVFREALLRRLPRIADRYFHSRLTSDMAERSHLVPRLRALAPLTYQLLRICFEVLATGVAVLWLDPGAALAVAGILAASVLPLLFALPILKERDLRLRTHTGALTRFYFDAMLGVTAIRAQHAEKSIQYEHTKLLGEWRNAARRYHFAAAGCEAVQLTAAFALVVRFVFAAASFGSAQFLLIAYWTLNLPALADELGALVRAYPHHRNVALRLLEVLSAPEERAESASQAETLPHISFRGVSVEVAGHAILEGIDLAVGPGEHVAIVGASGAGKSSLAGVLLGWYQPSAGEVLIDGQPLDPQALRRHIAWVDPAVQVWNRSLRANLSYGAEPGERTIQAAVDRAELRSVVEKLAHGLNTRVGEGGGLLSGGEGQRVRFARALLRDDVRLAILDEPFRGLDRHQRRELLRRAREAWRDCTLLCITHDIAETAAFDRVVVVERGRIAEQGSPEQLRACSDSKYARLLAAEVQARRCWEANFWRRIRVEAGCLEEAGVKTA